MNFVSNVINFFFFNKYFLVSRFIKKNFLLNKKNQNSIVLVEFNNWTSNHIVLPYFLKALSSIYNFQTIAYPGYVLDQSNLFRNILSKLKWLIAKNFLIKKFNVYNSFGVKDIFWPQISKDQIKFSKNLFKILYKKITKNEDIEKIKINDILVGDLIYDGYLRKYKVPTINLKSHQFQEFLLEFLMLFKFWTDYFQQNHVKAVIGFHSVYVCAIPQRIALKRNIETYVVSLEKIYRLNKKFFLTQLEYNFYKKEFNNISKEIRNKGIDLAKKKLKLRFKGSIDPDILYLTKSPYGKKINKRVIKKSKKIKILVAPHCFSDAPHSLGRHFFPDFYIWLKHLFEFTKKSNYDWYIKCHPNFTTYSDNTIQIVKYLAQNYNINYLEPNTSHKQIISEGINFVVTVHGNIGSEYPLFNIPVINASTNHYHKCYDFNINPKNKKEYENILLNLKKIKLKIKKDEIYKYYFMKYIYFNNNWLFSNLDDLLKKVGGYANINRAKIYSYWMKTEDSYSINKKILLLKEFLISKNYLFSINKNYL
jgi:hypothetical protein